MNTLEEAKKSNENKKEKDKLPFAVFICPKSNVGDTQDYKQVFTDIISDRIQKNINKNKNKISQKALKRIKKYDINKRNKREFKLLKNFQTT